MTFFLLVTFSNIVQVTWVAAWNGVFPTALSVELFIFRPSARIGCRKTTFSSIFFYEYLSYFVHLFLVFSPNVVRCFLHLHTNTGCSWMDIDVEASWTPDSPGRIVAVMLESNCIKITSRMVSIMVGRMTATHFPTKSCVLDFPYFPKILFLSCHVV